MTDDDYVNAVLDAEDVPCGACGAEAGEPCRDGCAHWALFDTLADEPPEEPPEDTLDVRARRALMAVAYRLPFSGLIDMPPPATYDGDLDLWLAAFAIWLEKYRALLREEVDHLQADSARAIALQLEKDVIRGFLGVSDGR